MISPDHDLEKSGGVDVQREDHSPKPSLERWNEPRTNLYRFLVTNYSFIIMGMNDSCLGALIPYVRTHNHNNRVPGLTEERRSRHTTTSHTP